VDITGLALSGIKGVEIIINIIYICFSYLLYFTFSLKSINLFLIMLLFLLLNPLLAMVSIWLLGNKGYLNPSMILQPAGGARAGEIVYTALFFSI
jgi:NADH-quinone oxidoreductase subunit M